MSSDLASPASLLFLPEKMADVLTQLKQKMHEHLLKRSLDAFDWHLEDLWRVAVFYTFQTDPTPSLPYYHKLLQFTETQPEAHRDVLCATAHVFAKQKQYADAVQLLQAALKHTKRPGKIPFFLAKAAYMEQNYTLCLQALQFFLKHYQTPDPLRLQAQSIQLMLMDQAGSTDTALRLLKAMHQEQPSWESQFLLATYSPFLSLKALPDSHHQDALHDLEKETLYQSEFQPLLAWYLPQYYKGVQNPYAASTERFLQKALHQIQKRTDYLVKHAMTPPDLQAYPSDQLRIALIGDFGQPALHTLSTLILSLCRTYSVTLFSTGEFALDLLEEHWIRTIQLGSDLTEAYRQVKMHQADLIVYFHHAHPHKNLLFLHTQRLAKHQVLWSTEAGVLAGSQIDEILYYELTRLPHESNVNWPELNNSIQQTPLAGTPVKKSAQPDFEIPADTFNLVPNKNYYFCPFSVADIHYDFYNQCADILKQDADGVVLFLASNTVAGERHWRQEMQDKYGEYAQRMQILPPINDIAKAGVMQQVEVILAPPYTPIKHFWWQYLPLGTPVIAYSNHTWQENWVKALYHQVHWHEGMVENLTEYASTAVSMAQDKTAKPRCKQTFADYVFNFAALDQSVHQWFVKRLASLKANRSE